MLAVVHVEEDEIALADSAVAERHDRGNTESTGCVQESSRYRAFSVASALFSDALAFGRVSGPLAAAALGVSKQRVNQKRLDQSPSLADVLLLIDGGGRCTDAAALLIAALQRRVEEARGRSAPPWKLLPVLSLAVGAVVGELQQAASLALGSEDIARAKAREILERCAAAHKQIAAVEACVRRLG